MSHESSFVALELPLWGDAVIRAYEVATIRLTTEDSRLTTSPTSPIQVDKVEDEERFFGGDIAWWVLLLVISVPLVLYGLAQAPDVFGFLVLSVGGVLAGIAFAQIVLRMPYLTKGFMRSVLVILAVSAVVCGIALVYSMTLQVPTAPPDVLYKPPISGG
jgi:hypothetical protein